MTDVQDEDDGAPEALDNVYSPEPQHALAPAKEFYAWHHPRKQFVRIYQWCAEVRNLIPQLGLSNGDPFRYLTLPGDELLDVRALHGVCQPLGVKLRYLGFNSVGRDTPAQTELALSQNEVRCLASIDEFSAVIEDRLEAIANDRSPASNQAMNAGPFHAINLDLCESIALREVGRAGGSSLEALGKLLGLQFKAATPWLLFITTKVEPALVGDSARDGFMKAIKSNADKSDEFRARLAKLIAGDPEDLEAQLKAAWYRHDIPFLSLFCTGLGKWLLSILAHAAPPRELNLLSCCYYKSGPNGPDMLSLAFRCEAAIQVVNDVNNILPPIEHPKEVSEVVCALNLTERVNEMFDLDGRLAGDKELQAKLIAQAGRLLAQARYSEAEYEAWATAKFA